MPFFKTRKYATMLTMVNKKRLLTGLQPSGQLHIGNYLGALKPFVDSYEAYDSFLMVVDYHALTSLRDPAALRRNSIEVVKDYIAAGVNPEHCVLFQQSQVQEHTELAWIFECLVSVALLELGHAYKDKVAKGLEPNAGLFNYPMLMAADILLYDTDVVPVGKDQTQHIEYAREAAKKFNVAYGDTFVEPQGDVKDEVAVIPGTDGNKMSKSYKNTIPLFGSDEEIVKAVMTIKTDSTAKGEPLNPETDVAFALHTHFSKSDLSDIESRYKAGSIGYKESKDILAQNILALIRPMRERRESITDAEVVRVLREGSEKARAIASEKMRDVRSRIGVSL